MAEIHNSNVASTSSFDNPTSQDQAQVSTSGSNVQHECSWCGMKFDQIENLDSHARTCQHNVIPNTDVGHEEIVQQDYGNFDSNAILQVGF